MKSLDKFIQHIDSELKSEGGYLKKYKGKYVSGDIRAYGEFCAENDEPVIKIATGHDEDEWVGTLAHEFWHFRQWITNSKLWTQMENSNIDVSDLLNKRMSPEIRKAFCKKLIALELDADKGAVSLVKKFQLDSIVNIERYIRRSNLILYKWSFVSKYGFWPYTTTKRSIELEKECPNKFITLSGYLSIPQTLESILLLLNRKH